MSIPAWPFLVLFAELAFFFRRVLFWPSEYTIPWDFQYYAFNQEAFLAHSLRAGSFPLWDPYTYCGMAFFTNIQSQVFYPPTLLVALLNNLMAGDHMRHLMVIELVLHVFGAGAFTFLLLRFVGCSRLAALTGASAFQLGCYFASQTQHFGAITGAAWLPFSVWAVLKLAKGPSSRWLAILAVSLALPILAGYPATICAVYLTTLFLTLGLIAGMRVGWRLLGRYAIGATGGILLSSIQLIPTLQIATMSISKYRGDWRGFGSGIRLEALPSLIWPNYFHILDLRGYSLPFNFTFLYLYCGLATLILVGLGLARAPRDLKIGFLCMTLASAILMHGDATPVGSVLLPGLFNLTRDSVYPEFLMVGFSLGIAVLAGLGANLLAGRKPLAAAVLLFVVADLTVAGSGRPMNTRLIKDEPGVTADQFDGSQELLARVRQRVHQFEPPARMETYDDAMGWTSMAPLMELPTPNGNDPFALVRYMNVRRLFCGGARWGRYYEVSKLDSPILDLIGARYIISRRTGIQSSKYREIEALPGRHFLYENSSTLPRFFLVSRTLAAPGMDEGLRIMGSPGFEPARTAVVEGLAGREYPPGDAPPVRTLSYRQNEVLIQTEAAQERFLVTSEANYPGWHAYVDGAEAPIVQTNVAFRGLTVPAGHHRVQFVFKPRILWWSGALNGLALLAAGFALFRPQTRVPN